MHEINVRTDNMELIGSQVIHLSTDSADVSCDDIPFKLKFLSAGDELRWELGPNENGVLVLSLYNFESRQGVGRMKPILAGKNSEMELYITFFVQTFSVSTSERVVSLNFYKKEL